MTRGMLSGIISGLAGGLENATVAEIARDQTIHLRK